MRRGPRRWLLAALVACGCGTAPKEAGFAQIQEEVAAKTGQRLRWYQDSPEDAALDAALERLLSRPLSAEAAVQIALLNNRGLQATYEELGLARAELVRAGLLANPVFEVAPRVGLGGEIGDELELSLHQDFLSLLSQPLRRSVAEAELEAARLRVTGAVLDLAWRVRSAFRRLQALERMAELRRGVVEATGASAEVAARLREAGNITEFDLATEQVTLTEARIDLAEAELATRVQRERLNQLLGLWGKAAAWRAEPELPPPPEQEEALERLEARAIEANLELARFRHRIEAAGRRLGLREVERWIPELELGVGATREEGGWRVGPSLSVGLPLWSPGRAAAVAAEAELRRLRNAYFDEAVRIRSAARIARERLQLARERVRYYREVVLPLREKLVREALLQYNAMQIGVFQLLEARRRQFDASRRYVESLSDYWLARADLRQLLDGRVPAEGVQVEGVRERTSVSDPDMEVHR